MYNRNYLIDIIFLNTLDWFFIKCSFFCKSFISWEMAFGYRKQKRNFCFVQQFLLVEIYILLNDKFFYNTYCLKLQHVLIYVDSQYNDPTSILQQIEIEWSWFDHMVMVLHCSLWECFWGRKKSDALIETNCTSEVFVRKIRISVSVVPNNLFFDLVFRVVYCLRSSA